MTVWYCAFLYGVNIPGGRKIEKAALPNLLSNLANGFQYEGSVGNSGNLLFSGPLQASQGLSIVVKNYLNVECVVRTLPDLQGCLQKVSPILGSSPPSCIQRDDAIWEVGVVFLSNPLPNASPDSVWRYSRKNARSLCLVSPDTLLVLKRKVTSNGGRIMWGRTVLDPLQRQLQQQRISLGYLTSRSLSTVRKVVDQVNMP